jgi:hypothetical protein
VVSGPPEDGFAAANNFCTERGVIEIRLIAVKHKKTKNRENMFIEKDMK